MQLDTHYVCCQEAANATMMNKLYIYDCNHQYYLVFCLTGTHRDVSERVWQWWYTSIYYFCMFHVNMQKYASGTNKAAAFTFTLVTRTSYI